MKAYRVTGHFTDDKDPYFATLKLAHDEAKGLKANSKWPLEDARIELVEFETDQATLCQILSGEACITSVLRTWSLTQRGGLKEVPNGE